MKLKTLSDTQILEYHNLYNEGIIKTKRFEDKKINLYDTKFAYHVVRLLNQAEQILLTGDLDLQQNKEQLKAIRRGQMSEKEIFDWAREKEKQLEQVYVESKLRHSPDEDKIKDLLCQCLEEHYGNLNDCVLQPNKAVSAIQKIQEIVGDF